MSDKRNAKTEFLETTKDYKVIAAKISFGDNYGWKDEKTEVFELKPLYTKEDYQNFLKFLDRKYDSGYGGQELFGTIFCEDGVWIARGEYDGSEWYEVHKYPDLRNSFTETDVLKYERNKKKIWREKNKEKILEYRRNYTKSRREKDPLFKLITTLRNRINLSFKRNGYTKKSKTYEILGCSYEEFKFHLEKQFVDNMSWSNQGEWHLDHIIPVSSGQNEDEIIKLNHYTNFQPLWGPDNLTKGNKIINI